jgi:DNA-binding NarL/FixJ family response regulator
MLSERDVASVLALIRNARGDLDRAEAILMQTPKKVDDLDPRSPLNKEGLNLTPRGVEVCYRLFDQGKSRYAVAQALDISYGAATHRFHAWEKLGGKDREPRPLD